MLEPRKGRPSGDLPGAIRDWCSWIHKHAELAARTSPNMRTPEGTPATWLDHCGMYERELMEAAMRANIWEPN